MTQPLIFEMQLCRKISDNRPLCAVVWFSTSNEFLFVHYKPHTFTCIWSMLRVIQATKHTLLTWQSSTDRQTNSFISIYLALKFSWVTYCKSIDRCICLAVSRHVDRMSWIQHVWYLPSHIRRHDETKSFDLNYQAHGKCTWQQTQPIITAKRVSFHKRFLPNKG